MCSVLPAAILQLQEAKEKSRDIILDIKDLREGDSGHYSSTNGNKEGFTKCLIYFIYYGNDGVSLTVTDVIIRSQL